MDRGSVRKDWQPRQRETYLQWSTYTTVTEDPGDDLVVQINVFAPFSVKTPSLETNKGL